ncbi:MAG TPA: ribonuclease H-like YkuK family protein [Flavobacteriales bacterium]|nr:ribonuclease H-like YkuK family protein [Flavobacteriales bacterium]
MVTGTEGFKRMVDGSSVDVLSHVHHALAEGGKIEVLVGSDSHNHGKHTVYTTTVVLRYFRNGAQVIYRRDKEPKVTDLWTRLWGEVERSLSVAELLRAEEIPVSCIDMDLNSDERFSSNKLHTAAVGYIRSHGYVAHTKPDLLPASWAANLLCNGMGRKHEAPVPASGTGAT